MSTTTPSPLSERDYQDALKRNAKLREEINDMKQRGRPEAKALEDALNEIERDVERAKPHTWIVMAVDHPRSDQAYSVLQGALARGWEPFAVSGDTMWLRKQQ